MVQLNGQTDPLALAARHGLKFERSLPGLDAVVLKGASGDARLTQLRSDPRVRSAWPDVVLQVHGGCCETAEGEIDPGPERATLERAFGPLRARTRGSPHVLVAVLDTGIDGAHPALAGALAGGVSLITGAPHDEDPLGHGTAMASLVAARDARHEEGLEGVAPEVRLLSIRVADARGRARASDVATGLVRAVDRGARVALISLGARRPAPVLEEAIGYAEARGVLVVAAAGNRNVHQDLYPAADPRVLSVASLTPEGELAFATAFAPSTDLAAPGDGALVALPRGGYGTVGGSSAAAARVAGLGALVASLDPALTPAQLRALLIGARRPLPALSEHPEVARVFRAGPVDTGALLQTLEAPCVAPRLSDPRVLPPAARPGEEIYLCVRVDNPSAVALAPAQVEVLAAGRPLATLAAPALAPGASRVLSTRVAAPGPGPLTFQTCAGSVAIELGAAEAGASADLALAELRVAATPAGGLEVRATVESRGLSQAGELCLRLGDCQLEPRPVPPLRAGERSQIALNLDPEQVGALPDAITTCEVRLGGGDDDVDNDVAYLDLLPPSADPGELATQYQQSGELTIIADAPWRLAPGRPHVPVLVYVAEKGDLDDNTWIQVDRIRLTAKEQAPRQAAGKVVYEDALGGTPLAAPDVVVLDEDGQGQRRAGRPDLRLFRHERLNTPGRYAIVRLPRGAFGLANNAGGAETRFLQVDLDWTNRRRFLRFFHRTRDGSLHKTLRVRFASERRPRFSGEGHYFDAHVHTMAEWYQSEAFDLLAPKRNLGGPIPMLKEAAYAIGLTDAPDDVADRVITTDHNAFYNAGDALRDRPPFGPTSAARSGGLSESERMRQLFGLGRGEEVAFSAPQNIFKGVRVPFGAHLLVYRAGHVEGPWHGGSGLARALGDAYPNLELSDLVEQLAKTRRGENRHAASYGAHPYGGTGWEDRHFEAAFELDAAQRIDRSVLLEGDGFVVKGVQVWNGDKPRHVLPHEKIDWWNLNPFVDGTYLRGDPDWDAELNHGLARWHDMLGRLLHYELAARPGVRFPRKVFVVAGNDAHGDFNYAESRAATIVNVQSTLKVNTRAFGRVLTYAFPDMQDDPDPGTRRIEAMLDGNSVLSDGPLVEVALDSEDRFDAASLRWTDQQPAFRDREGRMGGGGVFDGRGTALVRRGSAHVRLGYRHTSTPEFGAVRAIEIYRTSPGDSNPLTRRASGAERLAPRGTLVVGPEGQEWSEPLDPAEEGLITAVSALQLGAYSEDPAAPRPDATRCLTNPVYAVPYDVSTQVGRVETDAQGRGQIPPGELTVTLSFDASLEPADYGFELKALDPNGDSSDRSLGPISALQPAVGNGWATSPGGARDAQLTLVNQQPIPLDLDRYPSPSQVTLVVYSYDPLRDAFGNQLHPVAFTFELQGVGSGGGTGPSLPRAGSTAPGATANGLAPSGRGGGGGGGCALTPAAGAPRGGLWLWLGLLALALRRRRSAT